MRLNITRERISPYVVALFITALTSSCFYDFVIDASIWKVNINALFGSALNFSSIITGYLFAFYSLAIAPGSGFIEKIFNTKTFRIFTRYVLEAWVLGLIATLLSIPLNAAEYSSMDNLPFFWLVLSSLWVFFFVAMVVAFWRVVRVYFLWVNASSSGENKGHQ